MSSQEEAHEMCVKEIRRLFVALGGPETYLFYFERSFNYAIDYNHPVIGTQRTGKAIALLMVLIATRVPSLEIEYGFRKHAIGFTSQSREWDKVLEELKAIDHE